MRCFTRTCRLGRSIEIAVTSDTPAEADRILFAWEQLFCVQPDSDSVGPASVMLEFRLQRLLLATHPTSRERIYSSAGLSVWRTQQCFDLECGSSMLRLAPTRSSAHGYLDPEFWSSPLQCQRGFFTLAFLLMLSSHRLYGLHAAAIEKQGFTFLVVGDSGCGKTTVSAALVRRGWRYLSDDAVIIGSNSGHLEISGLSRGFCCTLKTQEVFRELADPAAQTGTMHAGKRLVNVDTIYPGQFLPHSSPQAILFPKIVPQSNSLLTRLAEVDALARLVRQSPGVLSDHAAVSGQLELLRLMVTRCPSYQLLLGSDVHGVPAALDQLLSAAVR